MYIKNPLLCINLSQQRHYTTRWVFFIPNLTGICLYCGIYALSMYEGDRADIHDILYENNRPAYHEGCRFHPTGTYVQDPV